VICRLTTCLWLSLTLLGPFSFVIGVGAQEQGLHVTANFSGQAPVPAGSVLELELSRPLLTDEGRLAVFIGDTDVTALCVIKERSVIYKPQVLPLPIGPTSVIIYLVSKPNLWTEVARLPLLVAEARPAEKTSVDGQNASAQLPHNASTGGSKKETIHPFQFKPSVSVNIKSQSTALFFPASNKPDRLSFTDVAVQASLQGNYQQGGVSIQNQFDLAGSSVQNEALRFGELGKNAPQLDLSSYLMQYQFHQAKLSVGQVSFGSSRQLINGFSSRGLSLTIPINKRFDVSAAIMNGTSVVGFSNFFGLSRSKHQVMSGTLGIELIPERHGGLRIEVSGLKGSLLPLNSFNQGNVTDAEKSHGASIRVIGSDKSQRLRFEGGFARSSFTNPADPLLYQGRSVVAVRPVSRDARYLDFSYDLLRNYKLIEKRPFTLSFAYHHEKVDPLYRSVAASPQADRLNNQFDLTGSFGELIFAFDNTHAHDNLAGIRSILETLTHRSAFNLAAPAAFFFSRDAKPSKWLPRLAYTFDRVHQLAAFVPINGQFSLSQLPNQISTNEGFSADWQFSSRVRLGYRFNYSFQDNRQLGRDRGDLLNEVNAVTFGLNPTRKLDLNFEVGTERASSFEQNTINSTHQSQLAHDFQNGLGPQRFYDGSGRCCEYQQPP
jgi:hypothetical protein